MSGKSRLVLALAVLAVGLLAAASQAEDKKKVFEDKPVQGQSASVVNFNKAYSLPFDSLSSLGTRIERARSVPDPVALASIAGEMNAAEKASGKKAPLTSEALQKEAIDLAKMRSEAAELKAIAALVKDETLAKDLDKLADKAKEQEQEEVKAAKAGERGKGIGGTLTVQNGTDDYLGIYANGRFLGSVAPFRDARFFVGHPPGTNTVLFLKTSDNKQASRVVFGDVPSFTWNITEKP